MSGLAGAGIVLASNSASRKAMLEAAGVAFEACGADVDERAIETEMEGAEPAEIAQALAAAKAAAVARQADGCWAAIPWSKSTVAGSTSRKAANRRPNICGLFRAR